MLKETWVKESAALPEPQRSQPSLRVLKGRNVGHRCPVNGERLTIGRRRSDLVLADPEVSSQHAEIVFTGSSYVLRDLKSTNGTFLNGEPIDEKTLIHGDEVSIGQTLLVWEMPEAMQVPAGISGGLTEMPSYSGQAASVAYSLGIYDVYPNVRSLAETVEDLVVGLDDPDGTEVLPLETLGIHLSLPPRTVVQLEFLAGPEKGRVVNLVSGDIVIGRHSADAVLNDGDVSRRHVALDFFGRDQIFMRDLGSTNGCYVDGEREVFARLQSGDTLVLGRSVVQLLVKDVDGKR